MSLINPSTRWWNREGTRRALAWSCWVVGAVCFFVVGAVFVNSHPVVIPVLFPLGLTCLLGGSFAHLAAVGSDDFDPRPVFLPVAGLFLCLGLGHLASGLFNGDEIMLIPVIFTAAGALAVVVILLLSRRVEAHRFVRTRVLGAGIITTGEVTRAHGYYLNHSRVTRVTVQFTDHEGLQRWASDTVGGDVGVGQRLSVRFLPDELDRTSGVVISG